MFKGMKYILNNKKAPKHEKQNELFAESPVTPILPANEILVTEKRQKILQEVRALLSLSDDEYNTWFASVINNFAEFVQNLPETSRSYYAGIGGLLDHALERASLSLFLCRTYLLPQETTLAALDAPEMLWVYAVFTAALFLDMGKIATHHTISITDAEGNFVKTWLPYSGAMTAQGTHYVYAFNKDNHELMRHLVTTLLARQTLPQEGFNWIASDPEVLQSWLAMLSDEQRQVGSIMTVIPIADAQLLEGYFTDRKVFRHGLSSKTIAFLAKLKEMMKAKEIRDKLMARDDLNKFADPTRRDIDRVMDPKVDQQQPSSKQSMFGVPGAGKALASHEQKTTPATATDSKALTSAFINWTKTSVDAGTQSVNQPDSGISVVEKGVVITAAALQAFIEEHKSLQIPSVEQLVQQLTLSGTITPGNVGQVTAVLVQNPFLVLPAGQSIDSSKQFQPISMTTPLTSSQRQAMADDARTAAKQHQQQTPRITLNLSKR